MRNKFAGTCTECGHVVPVGMGMIYKNDKGRWATRHLEDPKNGGRTCDDAQDLAVDEFMALDGAVAY